MPGLLPFVNGQRDFQVVVFRLSDESYGLDIGSVYEIRRFQQCTAVPTARRFVILLNLSTLFSKQGAVEQAA